MEPNAFDSCTLSNRSYTSGVSKSAPPQQRVFSSSTAYREPSSNQANTSSSPPPFSSSPPPHSSSSPPISPTFEYARTSSSTSSFADPLAANAKTIPSRTASSSTFSRRDSRVGRAGIAGSRIGNADLGLKANEAEDSMYEEPGSPSSGRGNRSGPNKGRGQKRSLPISPQQSQTTTSLNRHFESQHRKSQRSSPGDDDDDNGREVLSSCRLMPPPSNPSSLNSHQSVLGGQHKWTAPPDNEQASLVLAGLFGSSDNTSASEEANSSSDDAMDWGRPDKEGSTSSNNTTQAETIGLGLGAAFDERTSIPNPENFFAKAKSFQRWGSDPHSAFGASALPKTTSSPNASRDPSHPSQRRRLTGTSPKKLTRARTTSRFGEVAESIEMEIQETSEDSSVENDVDQHISSLIEPQADFWKTVVSDAVGIDIGLRSFKSPRSTLNASSKDLQFIHPCIADLKNYISIAPPAPPDKAEPSLTSSRSSSCNKDGAASEEDPLHLRNRQFAASLDRSRSSAFSRTQTPQNAQQDLNGSPSLINGTSTPNSPAGFALNRTISSKAALPSYEHLTLLLGQNQLSVLPSALFEVTKLTFLSLRSNKLRALPPAIGELRNLREFSIGGNQLSYLPSELLKLNSLTNFTYHPNPWKKAPSGSQLSVRPLLGSSAWRLVASSKRAPRTRHSEDDDLSPGLSHPGIYAASTPSRSSTPEAPRQLMGPPALPLRLQATANETRSRMLERTISDAQVDDLLAQGGELGSVGTRSSCGPPCETPRASVFPCEGRARYLSESGVGSILPSLQELCVRLLLSSQPVSINSPMSDGSTNKILLDQYENGVLRKCKGQLSVETMRILEVARRSSGGTWGSSAASFGSSSQSNQIGRESSRTVSGSSRTSRSSRGNKQEKANWCSETKLTTHSNRSDPDSMGSDDAYLSDISSGIENQLGDFQVNQTIAPVDVEASLSNGDDASKNPFFSRCPNPYHHSDLKISPTSTSIPSTIAGEEATDWPLQKAAHELRFKGETNMVQGPIFWEPIEIRYEWVSHIAGQKVASLKNLKTSFTGTVPQADIESKADIVHDDQLKEDGGEELSEPDSTISGEAPKLRKAESDGPMVDGSGCIPIQWRGCSRGCLAFLDEVYE